MKPNTLRNLLLTKLITICLLFISAAESGAEAPDLDGSNWQLTRLKVLGGFEFSPEEPGNYVLNFRSENRLTGTSDCNEISGSWLQEGFNLRFEPFRSSRKLCAPGSLHNNLILYLRDCVEFSIVNGNIIVTTSTPDIEIEFEAR
jgi:heat shock protein HslJ